MKKAAFHLLLLLVLACAASADDLVMTTASFQPAATLPGLPVWISAEVHNSGASPVLVPANYSVEVTPDDGETMVLAINPTGGETLPLPGEYQSAAPLNAGESRVIEFPSARALMIGGTVTGDARLWKPGTYTVRFVLGPPSRFHTLGSAPPSPRLVSPAFRFVIEVPQGNDADAWAALSEPGSKGYMLTAPKTDQVVEDLWKRYRTSRYGPYIAQVLAAKIRKFGGENRFAEADAVAKEGADRDGDGIIAAVRRVSHAAGKSFAARDESDVKRALEVLETGRSELEAMAGDGRERPWVRAMAEFELRRMATADDVRETVLRRIETKAANQTH